MDKESIDEIINSDILNLLYGDIDKIFQLLKLKKFKIDPSNHSFNFNKNDVKSLTSINKFTSMPNSKVVEFEASLSDGKIILLSCRLVEDELIVCGRVK